MPKALTITVIELTPEDLGVIERLPQSLQVPQDATVSAVLARLPNIKNPDALLKKRAVSVFGQYALPDTRLHEGDRIEILDDLQFDPKESRRRRFAHKQNVDAVDGQTAPRRSQKQHG